MLREKSVSPRSGLSMLFLLLALALLEVAGLVLAIRTGEPLPVVAAVVILGITLVAFFGLFMINPNQAAALLLFGDYKGTVKRQGLQWANPFLTKKKVSLRVRNFETGKMKVNDSSGNPVEIAAIVVWKVVETAEALFHVDDFENYVHVQSESAVRNLATGYPYDAHTEGEIALASHTARISDELRVHIQDRLEKAGIEVIEARISHLAYAPEIAAAMLQRQQAAAVVAARQKIVEGAVGMVETALEMLSQKEILELDEERKAHMVSNLLVVLCSDRGAHPVVNAGSLY